MLDKYIISPAVMDGNQPTALACEAGAGDKYTYTFLQAAMLHRVMILVTVTLSDMSGATQIVSFDRCPTFADASTGRTEIDTITVPNLTTAGTILYADCKQKFLPGEQLVVEQKVAATGGTGGDVRPFIEFEYIPETAGNCPNMIESA